MSRISADCGHFRLDHFRLRDSVLRMRIAGAQNAACAIQAVSGSTINAAGAIAAP
jgi:hypothetical protein